MIPQSFIDDLQARSDIVEVISSYIPLKRAGRNFKGLCPFHGEKTPSFMVSPQKQIFHCFGCQEGGGALQFLMLYEKINFVEAVEMLAKRAGIEIPYQQRSEKDKLKSTLYDAAADAAQFFHAQLLENKTLAPARQYLERRGLDIKTLQQFRIGYAPGRNSLQAYMRKKGYSLEILEKASLAIAHKEGYRDLFNDRITFPIFDIRSRVVGFGARIAYEAKDAPKYINSLESALYSKREHLFGFNFTKDEIAKADLAIVVEGYLDMIVPFMHGAKNIIASLGTALTIEQINLVRRYTNNIVLLFDSDKAGQLASLRALDLLLENEMKVSVASVPAGFDPDSLVRSKGEAAFTQIIKARTDFFDFKMALLKRTHDSETINGKTKIVSEMFLTLEKIRSEVEKYEYIKKLSDALSIKEEILIAEFRKTATKKTGPVKVVISSSAKLPFPLTERVILKFMFHNRRALALIKKNLFEEDFTFPLARKTVSYFFKQEWPDIDASYAKLLTTIVDKEIGGFVSSMLMDDDTPLDKEMFKGSILKLKEKRLKGSKAKAIKEAQAKGDTERLKMLASQYCSSKEEAR